MDFSHILTEPYILTLTILMAASLIILCIYYAIFHFRVGRYKGPKKKNTAPATSSPCPPVSVVLTAQNDAEWLKTNLVYLLEQDYPDFEVVVVDYMSKDETQFVLKILSENYPNLKVVSLAGNANGYRGKKYPMSIGIKSAKNDILVFADPNCRPIDLTNFSWLRQVVSAYADPKTEAVLGYCAIQPKPGPFNWLQQYDNLAHSVEYLAAAIMRHPFTGNGRNLSYRRSLFMRKRGFIYHYSIPDGADDMFVNQNCNGNNTRVVLTQDSFTVVEPMNSLAQWHSYRKHRTVTHKHYSLWLKLSRALPSCCLVLFYLAGALLLVSTAMPWPLLLAALLVKLAWQIVATSRAAARLMVKPVVAWLSPLLEIYFLFANTILSLSPLPKK
ncbi:MAG: glycosyltransferase [Bacteroidales bacterium]|nr:glycosyltransferase [Bacteroidales bacterium]